MQFCSKSELYESIKICTSISVEHPVEATTPRSSNKGRAGDLQGTNSSLFSADIDPISCANQYDFPCWSTSSPDLRLALQNELPDDWQELMNLPAFKKLSNETFFDRPDTSKLSTLLAGRAGSQAHAEEDGQVDGEEPEVSFDELFKKREVRDDIEDSDADDGASFVGADGTSGDGGPGGSPGSGAQPGPSPKKRSALHEALFGTETGDTTGGTTGGSTQGGDGSPLQGGADIVVFLPDPERTKIELKVSSRFSMPRTLSVLLAQDKVKSILGSLPGHPITAEAYEMKLHDEDGYPLDMAHNLSDKTIDETGEDEFVLQLKSGAAGARSSGAFAAGSLGMVIPPTTIKVLFSDLPNEDTVFKSFVPQEGKQLRHWLPKLQDYGILRVGEEYEFRLKSDDVKRLHRRSGLLKLTTSVTFLADSGVSEIKLCPKTYFDEPKHSSPKSIPRAKSTRARSFTQGAFVCIFFRRGRFRE